MYKQSAVVLGLLMGSSSAIQISGDDKAAKGPPAPEQVHYLEPVKSQQMSNHGNSELPLFPVPVGIGAGRSAFSLAQKEQEVPKKKKDPIGEPDYDPWVYNFSKDNMPAMDRSVNRLKDAPAYGWHPANQAPNDPAWGSGGTPGLAQKDKKDIGDQGIDEEVHGFAANDKSVLPQPWRRVKEAYPINGVFNPKFEWLDKPAAFAQVEKQDIGDQGINEEVHGFAANDKSVLPMPWRRVKEAYPNNGVFNPKFEWLDKPAAFAQVEKQDIGDQGINEEVHGFAANDKSVLPMPWRRVKEAYPNNGVFNPKFEWLDKPAAFAQVEQQPCNGFYGFECEVPVKGVPPVGGPPPVVGYHSHGYYAQLEKKHKHHHKHHHSKQDIGDQGINEEVHGFAANDKSVLPQPWRRVKEAYPRNGVFNPKFEWLDKPAAFVQKDKQDIGDQGIDEEVHGFAANDKSVLPQPWRRVKEAYPANGVFNPKFEWLDKPAAFAQKQDIGNSKYVRPDVWKFVDENIGQVPQWRRKTAPEHSFEPGKSGQGIEIINEGPSKK